MTETVCDHILATLPSGGSTAGTRTAKRAHNHGQEIERRLHQPTATVEPARAAAALTGIAAITGLALWVGWHRRSGTQRYTAPTPQVWTPDIRPATDGQSERTGR